MCLMFSQRLWPQILFPVCCIRFRCCCKWWGSEGSRSNTMLSFHNSASHTKSSWVADHSHAIRKRGTTVSSSGPPKPSLWQRLKSMSGQWGSLEESGTTHLNSGLTKNGSFDDCIIPGSLIGPDGQKVSMIAEDSLPAGVRPSVSPASTLRPEDLQWLDAREPLLSDTVGDKRPQHLMNTGTRRSFFEPEEGAGPAGGWMISHGIDQGPLGQRKYSDSDTYSLHNSVAPSSCAGKSVKHLASSRKSADHLSSSQNLDGCLPSSHATGALGKTANFLSVPSPHGNEHHSGPSPTIRRIHLRFRKDSGDVESSEALSLPSSAGNKSLHLQVEGNDVDFGVGMDQT